MDATYEQIGDDWIGRAADGRRTMLNRGLRAAQLDVAAGRFVCPAWPHCAHWDADDCRRALRAVRWSGQRRAA